MDNDGRYDNSELDAQLPDESQQAEIAEAIARLRNGKPDIDEEWKKMSQRMHHGNRWLRRTILGVAAAAACVVFLLFIHREQPQEEELRKGTVVVANNETQDIVVSEDNAKKTTVKGNKYVAKASANHATTMKTVKTPRGKDCNIVMPDGTHVWLNADSEMSFPASFTGQKREGSLKGEAFFEVSHNKRKPFVVVSDFLTTKVLGTVFNIRAFSAKDAQVVLVEGSVEVSIPTDGGSKMTMKPGNAVTLRQGKLLSTDIDTYPFTQRKDGLFYFHDTPMVQIMAEIGRWYNRTVVFENEKSTALLLHFVAERKQPINEVIEALNSMDGVCIEQEADGTIVIK